MAKTVVITGASSGIGAAVAREFARKGYNVALLARREDRLNQVKSDCEKVNNGIKVLCVRCDVTSEADVQNAAAEVRQNFESVDFVLANAGYGVMGHVKDLQVSGYREQLEVNVFGVLNTFYGFFEDLKKSKGNFSGVGSISGYMSFPSSVAYSMSKYAVRSFMETIYLELQQFEMTSTLISPGFVDSEIRKVDNKGVFKESRKDPAPGFMVMDTNKAAKKIVKAMVKGKREVVVTNHAKILKFINNHLEWLKFLILKIGSKKKVSRLQ